jgi:hypothetical protein
MARNQQGAGLLGDEIDATEQAFRDLAAASPATAQAYLDTANRVELSANKHMRLTEILEEETLKLAQNRLAVEESSQMVDAATESLEGYVTQWLTLTGLLSDRVMWDNLDTSFDNLTEKAMLAFGGTEQAVKEYNQAALLAAAEIDKVIKKLDLPEEVQTRIAILYDQGKFDQIYGLLRALDPQSVRDAFAMIDGAFFPGMASGGTVVSSGMALVGENGPELLNLPTGASVIPLTGTTGGGGNTINITVTSADPQAVVNAIRNFERRNGSGWRN